MGSRFLFHFCLAVAGSAGAGEPAWAACDDFALGLKGKMAEYTAYRARNAEILAKELDTERDCRQRGAGISASLAQLSDGAACKAELDAHGMDQQLSVIGGDCEAGFTKIKDTQDDLLRHYRIVKKDLDDVMAFLDESHDLDADCQPEMRYAHAAVLEFERLEGDILGVDGRSLDGKTNYGKFKTVAERLRALTGANGARCEGMASTVTGLLSAAVKVSSPKGRVPGGSSDITGVVPDGKLANSPGATSMGARAGTGQGTISSGASGGAPTTDSPAAGTASGDLGFVRAVKKVPTGQVSAGAALWSESADPEEGLEVAPSSVSGVGPGGGRTAEGRAPAAAVMGAGKPPAAAPPVSGGVAAASPDEVAGEVDLFTRVHRRYRAVPIP